LLGVVGPAARKLHQLGVQTPADGLGKLVQADLPREPAARVVLDVLKDDTIDAPLWASRISAVLNNREESSTPPSMCRQPWPHDTWAAAVQVVENAVRRD
jgi:hypothetical protein